MQLPAGSAMQDVGQIASHNTNTNSNWIEHLDHVNAVELDVWPLHNWIVSHNFDVGAGNLDGYMADLAKWHKNHPDHDLITVFFEIKRKEGWKVDDFEKILLRNFRRSAMFRPMDLVKWAKKKNQSSTATNLRKLVKETGWPTFAEVKNKIMFVINNDGDHVVDTYLAERPLVREHAWSGSRFRMSWPLCFVMSSRGDKRTGYRNIVIFNHTYADWPASADNSDNCLRRAYEVGSGNDEMVNRQLDPARRLMQDKAINYLCYDYVNHAFWTLV